MFDIGTLLVLIPALPLVAAVITGLFGPWLLRSRSHVPAVTAIGLSFLFSLLLLFRVYQHVNTLEHGDEKSSGWEQTVTVWTWADIDRAYRRTVETPEARFAPWLGLRNFRIEVTLRADTLTAIMLVTVTLVAWLVAIYSVGYMHGDPGYWRFFSYINLFVFSMTMLVSVSNFLLLYIFWEAVGLCSYLLIGFWYQKPEAAAAGKKAFLVNRVGDFGFALGVFLIWVTYGTLNFHDTPGVAGILGQARLLRNEPFVGGWTATAICLLLMAGACGKSAQFPLHVWLPDAMEGPTPVSALIHAATMVTAGVYMVARCAPLFAASAEASMVVAMIGCFTALLAALIALTQYDLKRILAYSTISQLGYMFLALGTGSLLGITAGMFHLFTHAFFKALLFLGAGSVMHALGGVIDIRRFGGLRRQMPLTFWTFLVGALALAGVVPFAGFWSKDMILAAVHSAAESNHVFYWLYWTAVITAGLTAFYTFRAVFISFFGREKLPEEAGHHIHDAPPTMAVALVALAVGSVLVGLLFEPTGWFASFLDRAPQVQYVAQQAVHSQHNDGHLTIAIVSTVVALVGIGLAAVLYLPQGRGLLRRLHAFTEMTGLFELSFRKFWFDEIYYLLIVLPLRGLAELCYWIDQIVIDNIVNIIGRVPVAIGAAIRGLQSGFLQYYLLGGAVVLLVLMVLFGL